MSRWRRDGSGSGTRWLGVTWVWSHFWLFVAQSSSWSALRQTAHALSVASTMLVSRHMALESAALHGAPTPLPAHRIPESFDSPQSQELAIAEILQHRCC